jgi:hypothetical protein
VTAGQNDCKKRYLCDHFFMTYVIRVVGRGTPLGAIDQPNLPGSSQPTINKGGYVESPGWYPGTEPTVPQQPPQPGGGGGGLSPFKKLFTAANYVPLLPSVTPTPSQGSYLPPRVIDVPPAPDGSGSDDQDGTIPHPQFPPADGSVEPQPQVPPPSEPPPDGNFPIVPTSNFPTDFATSAAKIRLWGQQHRKAIMWGGAVALLALVGSKLISR